MTAAIRIGTSLVSAIVLIVVNVVPLIGVAFWGWSLMMILVLYWIESGIVGVINIFKIARARGGEGESPVTINGNRVTIRLSGVAASMSRGPIIGFFVVHYGIFWVVHGIFVFLMPLFAGFPVQTSIPGRRTSASRRWTSARSRSTACSWARGC